MNNFKKVIALSVVMIMVISISVIGVSAEELPTVYWDTDIVNFTDEFLGYGGGSNEALGTKNLTFDQVADPNSAMAGTVNFAGNIVVDDIANYENVPEADPRTGTAVQLKTSSSDAVRPEITIDFTDSTYSDVVKFDFDALAFDDPNDTDANGNAMTGVRESLFVVFTSDKGNAQMFWNSDYGLISITGIKPNSNGLTYAGTPMKDRVWTKWTFYLDMKTGDMRVAINDALLEGADNEADPTAYKGVTGNLKQIQIYREIKGTSESPVYLDNISVRGYKEAPLFIDAEGKAAPTTNIPATRELNVKFDTFALFNDAVIDDSNNPFVLKKVSDESTVAISKVTKVGTENTQWKLYLGAKLEDDTEYVLTAENVTDSVSRTATAKYTFKTAAAPSNFGIYKLGYEDGSGNPKYEFNNGDTVKANLLVTNTSGEAQTVTGAFAIYKKTEKGIEMIGITASLPEAIAAGGNFDFSSQLTDTITDLNQTGNETYFAKTFAFKGDLTGAKFIPFAATSNIE